MMFTYFHELEYRIFCEQIFLFMFANKYISKDAVKLPHHASAFEQYLAPHILIKSIHSNTQNHIGYPNGGIRIPRNNYMPYANISFDVWIRTHGGFCPVGYGSKHKKKYLQMTCNCSALFGSLHLDTRVRIVIQT